MTIRRNLELRSGPVLVLIGRLPKAVPFLVVMALLLGGLALQGTGGAVLLFVLLVLMSWVTFMAWPALQPGGRVLRIVVLALIAGAAAAAL